MSHMLANKLLNKVTTISKAYPSNVIYCDCNVVLSSLSIKIVV